MYHEDFGILTRRWITEWVKIRYAGLLREGIRVKRPFVEREVIEIMSIINRYFENEFRDEDHARRLTYKILEEALSEMKKLGRSRIDLKSFIRATQNLKCRIPPWC